MQETCTIVPVLSNYCSYLMHKQLLKFNEFNTDITLIFTKKAQKKRE